MAIEIPEAYGGAGATLLPLRARGRGVLARRPVDRRPRRRPEHPGRSTLSCAGAATTSSGATCRSSRRRRVGAYALSEAGSGSDAFALTTRAARGGRRIRPQRPQAVDHQRQRGGHLHRLRHRQSRGRLPRHHRVRRRARLPGLHRRQEGRQARHPRQQHLRTDPRRLPRAARPTCSARSARATRPRSRR